MTARKTNWRILDMGRRGGIAALAVAGLLLLAGCGDTQNVWSSITGDQSGAATATSAPAAQPAPTESDFASPVGRRIAGLETERRRLDANIARHQTELRRVRRNIAADRATYAKLVRRQPPSAGAGRNAALVENFGRAQGALDRVNDDVAVLDALAPESAGDSALATRLGDEIKTTATLPGASAADGRRLAALRHAVDIDRPKIERMNGVIVAEISRQNEYIAAEHRRLASIDPAGTEAAAPPEAETEAAAAPPPPPPAPPARHGHALVTIRFDRPNVPYEHALYTAVNGALNRRPGAHFDLVAVSPSAGSAAQVSARAREVKRNAGGVLRSLVRMGLPANRIAISATTSGEVRTGEVRIYVK